MFYLPQAVEKMAATLTRCSSYIPAPPASRDLYCSELCSDLIRNSLISEGICSDLVRSMLGPRSDLFGPFVMCSDLGGSPKTRRYGHDNTLLEYQVSGFLEQEESGTLRVG